MLQDRESDETRVVNQSIDLLNAIRHREASGGGRCTYSLLFSQTKLALRYAVLVTPGSL